MAETTLTLQPILIAILGGVVPSLIWLWFWLKQDKRSPEPTGLIALSFFVGMAVVYFVLPVQKMVVALLPQIVDFVDIATSKLSIVSPDEQTIEVTLWAFTEELAKFAAVFLVAFKSKFFDEPIDAVVYLITAALGFAAMENILYIFKDLTQSGLIEIIGNSNMRFIGATIAHTVSSAIIGIAIAFSFYAPRYIKIFAITISILIASLLHAYFNLSIMESDGTLSTLFVFSQFWVAVVGVIVLIAIIKRFPKNPNTTNN